MINLFRIPYSDKIALHHSGIKAISPSDKWREIIICKGNTGGHDVDVNSRRVRGLFTLTVANRVMKINWTPLNKQREVFAFFHREQ